MVGVVGVGVFGRIGRERELIFLPIYPHFIHYRGWFERKSFLFLSCFVQKAMYRGYLGVVVGHSEGIFPENS